MLVHFNYILNLMASVSCKNPIKLNNHINHNITPLTTSLTYWEQYSKN